MKPRLHSSAVLFVVGVGVLLLLGAAGCTADGGKSTAQKTNQVPVVVFEPPAAAPSPVVVVEPGPAPESVNPPAEGTAALPPPPAAAPVDLSETALELVHMAQARVGNDVLLAYIDGVRSPFGLKADDIVYLTDLGVPADTIAAMVRRDQMLEAEAMAAAPVLAPAVQEPVQVQAPAPIAPESAASAPPMPTTESITAESSQPVTYNYFYNTLSPYGTWVEVPEYGWCWQPSVAVIQTGWRPYCDNGRWLWTDCGWYWQSYYSWGWAPFHYGRWAYTSRCGWVWSPGTYWGPSWVTWRYYDGYCGWAPLPPTCGYRVGVGFTYYGNSVGFSFGFGLGSSCYTFVPTRYFCDARPGHYRVPDTAVNNFYGNTTVVNNYVHGNNNTIVNKGIGTEIVSAANRSEIPKVRLADVGGQAGSTIPAERLSRDGRTLAVYRPQLPEQASRPPATVTRRQEQAKTRSEALLNSRTLQEARASARPSAADLASRTASTAVSSPVRSTAPSRSSATIATSGRPERPTPSLTRSEQPTRTVAPTAPTGSAPSRTAPARSPWSADSATPSATARNVPARPSVANPAPITSSRMEPTRPTPTPSWRSATPTPTRPSVIAPAPEMRDIRSTLPRATVPNSRVTPSRPTYTTPSRSVPEASRSVTVPAPTLRSSPSPSMRSTPATPTFRSAPPTRPSMAPPSSGFGRSSVSSSGSMPSGPIMRSAPPARPTAPSSPPSRGGGR